MIVYTKVSCSNVHFSGRIFVEDYNVLKRDGMGMFDSQYLRRTLVIALSIGLILVNVPRELGKLSMRMRIHNYSLTSQPSGASEPYADACCLWSHLLSRWNA